MNTKNIFKMLAVAMLMPAMLLTTACSSDDDLTNPNPENIIKKGYELPVTVNVTREGDADATNRASYNESTRKLSFTAGDKLFVNGYKSGLFAGTLDYDAVSGKFSGTITTQNTYSGTADELLSSASYVQALLLPAGYGSYGFLSILGSEYNATPMYNYTKAFAESKAAAVEQLSLEQAGTYISGFVLAPGIAILNFSINGLAASTEVEVNFVATDYSITKNVTTDGSGTATFVVGVPGGFNLNTYTLTVGGNDITIVSSTKVVEAGKIYNITRSV